MSSDEAARNTIGAILWIIGSLVLGSLLFGY